MLVDLNFQIPAEPNPNIACYFENGGLRTILTNPETKEEHPLTIAVRLGRGLYYSFCLDNFLETYSDHREVKDQPGWPWNLLCPTRDLREMIDPKYPPVYGNADNLQQIYRRCRRYWTSERQFILTVHWISREHNPGWRWHKNGGYMGVKKRQCESIGDERHISEVIHFTFIEVTKKAA